jgi:hypothetical protein
MLSDNLHPQKRLDHMPSPAPTIFATCRIRRPIGPEGAAAGIQHRPTAKRHGAHCGPVDPVRNIAGVTASAAPHAEPVDTSTDHVGFRRFTPGRPALERVEGRDRSDLFGRLGGFIRWQGALSK